MATFIYPQIDISDLAIAHIDSNTANTVVELETANTTLTNIEASTASTVTELQTANPKLTNIETSTASTVDELQTANSHLSDISSSADTISTQLDTINTTLTDGSQTTQLVDGAQLAISSTLIGNSSNVGTTALTTVSSLQIYDDTTNAEVIVRGTTNGQIYTSTEVTASALPNGAATEATLQNIDTNLANVATETTLSTLSADITNGAQKSQIVDSLGNVVNVTNSALDVNIASGSITASNPSVSATDAAKPTDATLVGGSDGTNLRALKVDATGALEVISATLATETTLANVATEATVSTLATEATVSTLATEATVSTLASASAQTDGSQKTQIVDGSNNVIASHSNALDVYVTNSNGTTLPGTIDTNNSTTTPLGANSTFTGTWTDIKDVGGISIGINSNVNSAVDGVIAQFSDDGVNIRHEHYYTLTGGGNGLGLNGTPEYRYFRIKYTNNSVAQTSFVIQTILKPTALFPSQYRVSQPITDETQSLVTKGVIVGKSTAGSTYVPVKVNPSGALTVESTVTSSVLPTGAATQTTLSSVNNYANDIASNTWQTLGYTSTIKTNTDNLVTLNERLPGGLVSTKFDGIALTYVAAGNGVGEIYTATYKLGATTVATLTLTYDSSNRLTSVVKT